MGLASRSALSSLLVSRGWRGATPVAVCFAAGTAHAHTWIGTLGTLDAASLEAEDPGVPATIVIGEVVSVAGALASALSIQPCALAAG